MVGHWTFDTANTNWTASTTADTSGNNNTGTLTNFYSATSTVSGKKYESLVFNSTTNYVNAGTNSSLHFTGNNPRSWGGWFKLSSHGSMSLMTRDYRGNYFKTEYTLKTASYASWFTFACNRGDDTNGDIAQDITINPQLNAWYHVMCVLDNTSGTLTLYINGVSKAVDNSLLSSTSDQSAYPFLIGAYLINTTAYSPLYGQADDVRIYSRALSQTDITELYSAAFSPAITTSAASSITPSTATLNGSIDMANAASSTVRGFAYGTDSTLTSVIATTSETGTFGTGSFSADISGLISNTTYYFRAYATNATSTGYGNVQSFSSLTSPLPSVTSSLPTSVSTSSMILNGSITAEGSDSPTMRGFAWGTSSNLTTGTATTTESGTFSISSFATSTLSFLSNTTYYFRAYANNSAGTGFGIIRSTTTLQMSVPSTPTSISAATSSPNEATITFTPNHDGGSPILYYLASSTPGNITAMSTESPITVTGLSNSISYTFAVYAVNNIGTSSPSSASNAVIPINVPTILTPSFSSITATTTIASSTILNTSGASVIRRGFVYSTDSTFNTVVATTTESGLFNAPA